MTLSNIQNIAVATNVSIFVEAGEMILAMVANAKPLKLSWHNLMNSLSSTMSK